MKTLRRLLLFVLVLGVLGVGTLAGTSWYYGGGDGYSYRDPSSERISIKREENAQASKVKFESFEKIDNETGDGSPPFTAFHVSRFTNDGHYA